MFILAIETAASGTENQDRATSFRYEDALVVVVSDGAGGIGGGSLAAHYTTDRTEQLVRASSELPDSDAVGGILKTIDKELAPKSEAGECTAVVLVALEKSIWGASVGDSAVWMVGIGPPQNLTSDQHRKPLLGSSEATPVAFGPHNLFGSLVIGTDGLFNYVKPDTISTVASLETPSVAASLLIDAGRLPSGDLQDDITVVVCKWKAG